MSGAQALLGLWLLAQAPAPAQGGAIGQRVRQVVADCPASGVINVPVVASPKVTTTVRLPESFAAEDVLCGGSCVDATEQSQADRGTNWVLERRPEQASLHLWPARLPSAGNPPSAFVTNVYVAGHSGRAYNITLSLLDLGAAEREADAVVDVICRGESPTRPRPRRANPADGSAASSAAWMAGAVHCHKPRNTRPVRSGLLVARLQQLCRMEGATPMLWAVVELENRSHAPLRIDGVTLEPAGASFAGDSEAQFSMDDAILPGKSRRRAVAMRRFGEREVSLGGWRLDVVPEPEAHSSPMVVSDLHF